MEEFLKAIAVIGISSVKYIFGLATAVYMDMGFIPSVLLTIGGGMLGVVVFGFLSKSLKNFLHLSARKSKKLVKFTRFKRWLVRFRCKFGLAGIAALTPILLQVPIGTYIAVHMDKNYKKVALYMLISFTFYSIFICGIIYSNPFHLKEAITAWSGK